MRWPLRNQILVRILLLLVITVGAITYANIRSIIATNRASEVQRLQRISRLLTTTQFPLTSSVLENMKSLSGAEFILVNELGKILSRTQGAPREVPKTAVSGDHPQSESPAAIQADGRPFYHAVVRALPDRNQSAEPESVHIFVPRQSDRSIWWQASKSPLTIALLVLPLALLFSFALASQVTRPLAKLQQQVTQIAKGDARPIPLTTGNDEIRDLNVSVNEMAEKLQDHDNQLRRNERLRTMVQFGSGIAHHLRNSATGCKMAIELLAGDHREIADSENFQVARRQLGLMDNYIRKFLMLSKSSERERPTEIQPIDLNTVLESVAFLLRPSAAHLNVKMAIDSRCDDSKFEMSEEDAEQLMMNLIRNGITAASEKAAAAEGDEAASVEVDLNVRNGNVVFSVTDNGAGPPEDIAENIFQPFVTGSREGTGLGLSLVREIVERAGGSVDWNRQENKTTFTVSIRGRDESETKPSDQS